MTAGKTFDEIEIGETVAFSVIISEASHNAFAKLSSDTSPVHTNDDFARTNGFSGKIGYAFHISALLSRLYGMYLPGGTSICLKQESNFINPWYPGDKINVTAEVVRKIESTRIVEIKSEMKREGGMVVFRGMGCVRMLS